MPVFRPDTVGRKWFVQPQKIRNTTIFRAEIVAFMGPEKI
jgi:hypothetical protein